MTENEAIQLFKCLADKSRLQILKSLAVEDMYVERLAERLGLSAPTISFHLKKLSDAGAVKSYKSQYYMMYSLNPAIFKVRILDILQQESDEAALQETEEFLERVFDGRMGLMLNTMVDPRPAQKGTYCAGLYLGSI